MMKRMKTLLWVLVLGISVLVAGQSVRAATIKMAWFVLPPHMYQDESTGEPRGAAIAYVEAVADRMGYTVEWVGPFPLMRLQNSLKTTDDGVVGSLQFPKLSEFETYVHFTDTPYCHLQPVLIVRQGNPLTAIRSIDDILGYRIGFSTGAGSYYTPFLEAHRHQLHFEELFGENWLGRILRILVETDRLDAVFDRNKYTLPFVAARLKLDTQIKVLPLPDPPVPVHVVFSKAAPQGERLVEEYNTAVQTVDFSYDDFLAEEFEQASQE